MNYIYGLLMSLGMFTVIPCPYKGWREDARGHMLVCFPIIGGIIGFIWYVLYKYTYFIPMYLRAVIVAFTPWFITGFIHIDGYMDVCDAVMSRRDLETKQRILKDSRVGAFAVICICILSLTQVAAVLSFIESGKDIISTGLILIPIASRICASLAVLNMKPMHTSQYTNLNKKTQFNILLLLMFCAIFLIFGISVRIGISVAVTMTTYSICALYGNKMLGGMNGDISGYALTLGELAGIIGLII